MCDAAVGSRCREVRLNVYCKIRKTQIKMIEANAERLNEAAGVEFYGHIFYKKKKDENK